MKEDYLKFTEWVAEAMTLELLEYDFSEKIWFLQSRLTDNKIVQFDTTGLYNNWKANSK